jgi:phosphatidylserine/phosphatidylglycerophosphate/cardiolipin synthase-like enzyme
MHNKFVVLLQNGAPLAVWTGSTNWTDGGLYGQFNLGQAVYDPVVAKAYDDYWNILAKDPEHDVIKQAAAQLAPVPGDVTQVKPGFTAIISPENDVKMLDLYGKLCSQANMLLVCAPFELAEQIRSNFHGTAPGKLDLLLLDKAGSLGNEGEVGLVERDLDNEVVIATTRSDGGLHDMQNRLLESGESFHHQGIHIHAKIIACDPLGPDPIIVFGSANFSNGSTMINDENSVISRGNSALADIYVSEFMRVFDTYKSRYKAENVPDAQAGLSEDASWSAPYYVPNSTEALNRQFFAGTL